MVNTRPKNAASHPGQVVLDADSDGKKKCRSPAEVKREREEKERLRKEAEEKLTRGIQAAAQLEDQINAMESAKRANAANPKAAAATLAVPTPVQVHSDTDLQDYQRSMALVSDEEHDAADLDYDESQDVEEDIEETYCNSDDYSCSQAVDPSEPAHIRIARLEKELAELRGVAAPLSSIKGKGKISPKKKLDLHAEIMAERRSKDQSSIEAVSESARHSKKRPSQERYSHSKIDLRDAHQCSSHSSINGKSKAARIASTSGGLEDARTVPTSPFPAVGKPRTASRLIAPAWAHAAAKLALINNHIQGEGSHSTDRGQEGDGGRATTLMPIRVKPISINTTPTTRSSATEVLDAIVTTGTRSRPTMNDLPIGTWEIFKSDFLPAYFDFLGSRIHPFDMSESRLIVEQQFIWDTYLGSFEVNIAPRSPVYKLLISTYQIQQRSYEWKTGLGQAAFIAVGELWESDKDFFGTALGRAKYVKWALGQKKPFSWENGHDFLNPFHGPLVLAVLAKHFDEANGKYGYGNPCGALALSATAAERALSAWSTGSLEKVADFGAKVWRDITKSYMVSILQLSDDEWVSIIDEALTIRRLKDKDTPANLSTSGENTGDDRSMLISGPLS
ncbi:hypothetical protein BOTBODRAFT_43493 [Botryobasidium botryosum FD-172 SS1]|uniref:Uncharacterized protein n=1 Tax=Botryobasidium botryosum (strain FD-172 SS1) TaxID=930990 RepID=A0A067MLE8_BOTB1|nr:hypothetical protein BOTBODRAFT_43493 [Botryobasidium botryosum FD-172 SS1]